MEHYIHITFVECTSYCLISYSFHGTIIDSARALEVLH